VRLGDSVSHFKFVDGAFTRAFANGLIEGVPGVPDEPVELLRRAGWRDLEARTDSSVVLTRAERSETEFWTDRGRMAIPAWRIETSGARGAIWAVDEENLARCWFPPPSGPTEPKLPPQVLSLDRATIFDDGVTLRLRIKGESMIAYEGSVRETSTAGCVFPVERRLKSEAAGTAWPHSSRGLTVRLARPLGARVLVAPAAYPLAVLS
jgi:hypothetical protein